MVNADVDDKVKLPEALPLKVKAVSSFWLIVHLVYFPIIEAGSTQLYSLEEVVPYLLYKCPVITRLLGVPSLLPLLYTAEASQDVYQLSAMSTFDPV